MSRVAANPALLRAAAHQADRAADEAARGLIDMRWIATSTLADVHRERARAAVRSTRSVPEELRAIARELRRRADLFERADAGDRTIGVAGRIGTKWLRKKASKLARKTLKITTTIKALVAQSHDYGHLAIKALHTQFWGNFCGAGNKGESKAPTDTLDSCCKQHDQAYATLGLGAFNQFTPQGLVKGAEANAALAACAQRQPDGTESENTKRFDPDVVDPSGVTGDDARSGVIKLFSLMATLGNAIAAAKAKVQAALDKLPFVSKETAAALAEAAINTAAQAILAKYKDELDKLGALA